MKIHMEQNRYRHGYMLLKPHMKKNNSWQGGI